MARRCTSSLFAATFLLCATLLAVGQALPHAPDPAPLDTSNVDGTQCTALLREGEQAIHREDFSSAIRASQQALSTCADHSAPLLLLARAQMLDKEFNPAAESLHSLLAADPRNVGALILLGQVEYLSNHDDEATLAFQQAIAAAPDKPDPHYFLGRLDYEDGRVTQAIEQFKAAIQLDSRFYKAYDNLGLCYEALGDNPLAAKNYVKALSLVYKDHPEYDSVYLNLAEFMLKQDNSQKAFDLAAEAASRNPRNPRSFFLAGKALEQAGHDETSLRWLKQAAQMDPAYPDPHYLLARIYRKQGKTAEAKAEVETFEALSARWPKIKR